MTDTVPTPEPEPTTLPQRSGPAAVVTDLAADHMAAQARFRAAMVERFGPDWTPAQTDDGWLSGTCGSTPWEGEE